MRISAGGVSCRQQIVSWMFIFPILLWLGGCQDPAFDVLRGQTMGTYYAVQHLPQDDGEQACQATSAELEAILEAVNGSMSTYRADSELTRINQSNHPDNIELSSELSVVLDAAAQLWRSSAGAFDVTVGPLVNLWGFGPSDVVTKPSQEAQQKAAQFVGMDKLTIDSAGLRKEFPEVYIDLSALAKGFAVDQIASFLQRRGCRHFMVDIGGEIRVGGMNAKQQVWRIGIEVPDPAQVGVLQTVLEVTDLSVATSGDYRNFRVVEGQRIDHVLDPRSGKPADNNVVSATVLHSSAMWADAYATTLMVLGMDEGMAFAEREEIAAYMMARKPTGDADLEPAGVDGEEKFESRYNAAMRAHLPADFDNEQTR